MIPRHIGLLKQPLLRLIPFLIQLISIFTDAEVDAIPTSTQYTRSRKRLFLWMACLFASENNSFQIACPEPISISVLIIIMTISGMMSAQIIILIRCLAFFL